MKSYMKMSRLYAPTLKEDPTEAELASHRLLLRAGFIRKEAAGLYTYLPLAWRSIRKIEQICREEQEAIGSQEMMTPILTDGEFWHQTGRWIANSSLAPRMRRPIRPSSATSCAAISSCL